MNDKRLENAVHFIKQGDKKKAGLLLQEIVKENPRDESAWFYLAFCVSKTEQKRYCLERVLKINPNNTRARKAIQELEIQDLPENTALSSRNSKITNEKRVDNESVSRDNKNLIKILLAGSLFLLSSAVCVVAVFLIFSQRNLSHITIAPPLIVSTPTDSPEKIYVEKMSQNMILLDSFNNTLVKWDTLITTVIPGYNDLTYGQSLALLPTAINTMQLSKQAGLNYEFESYVTITQTNVTPVAQQISNEGFGLLTAWHSVTPPSEIRLPHEQIETCVQYKIDLANDIIKLLQQYIVPTRDLSTDPCGNYTNSISAISAYINNYDK